MAGGGGGVIASFQERVLVIVMVILALGIGFTIGYLFGIVRIKCTGHPRPGTISNGDWEDLNGK